MTAADNQANMRRIPEEMFNKGNLAVADEVIAADYVEHVTGLPPDFPSGVEGLKQVATMIRAAFPDFHYTIEDEIAEGDKVVQRLTARHQHRAAVRHASERETGDVDGNPHLPLCERQAGGTLG